MGFEFGFCGVVVGWYDCYCCGDEDEIWGDLGWDRECCLGYVYGGVGGYCG